MTDVHNQGLIMTGKSFEPDEDALAENVFERTVDAELPVDFVGPRAGAVDDEPGNSFGFLLRPKLITQLNRPGLRAARERRLRDRTMVQGHTCFSLVG